MSADDHWYYRPFSDVHRSALPLAEEAATAIRDLAAAAHPRETGGLLLGWWNEKVPVVRDAIEVLDPRAGHTRWTRHEAAARAALLAAVRAADGSGIGYVGEWHSHPADVGPSSRDIRELQRISRQYPLPLVLAVARRRGPIDVRIARNGRLTTPHRLAATRRALRTVNSNSTKETP